MSYRNENFTPCVFAAAGCITMMTNYTPLQIQSQELRQNSGPKYFSSSFKSRISSYFARNWTIYSIAPTNAAFTTFFNSWIRIDK
jgi:hypothetical protein